MTQQGYPSKNPADGGSLAGALRTILGKELQRLQSQLPAKVVRYDRARNLATVQPLIAVLTTDGGVVSRAPVAQVPVLALGGGGFVINFPLKPGDLGWIEASDRDISLFMQSLGNSKPNTLRKHSFEDGRFVPDIFRNYSLNSEDESANMVIQAMDGSVRLALWPDRVKATAGPASYEVNADGAITAIAPVRVFYDTPLVQFAGVFQSGVGGSTGGGAGESTIQGTLRASEKLIGDEDVLAAGVSGKGHEHGGVISGGDISGPPVGGA